MSTRPRPNILFFFTDDQRYDTIRALGCDAIHTPTLDRLVRAGTSFTHAHVMGGTSPAVCMPSRAMLMTGRSLFHLDGSGASVPDAHRLLGEVLREAGYATFGTGKWHNGPAAYARSFTDGAEIFFGGMSDHWNVPACDFDPTGEYSTHPVCPNPGGSNEIRERQCDHIKAGKHSTELFADATIDFLHRRPGDQPFFAYVSFMAPHDPRIMPQEYLDRVDPAALPLPPNYMPAHPFDNGELKIRDELLEDWPRTEEASRQHLAEYYAMIAHVDAEMGRVLQALEETGAMENTIIVFAGDNGLAVGRHGLMGKQNLYEHSVRVPLLLAGPGVPRGETREAYAYLYDIFPTLCELLDLPVADTVDGQSLMPAIADPAERIRPSLYCAYRDVQRSVRDERYKLIEYVVGGRRTTQLFDLTTDPWELDNRAGDPAAETTVERLRHELLRWRDAVDDTGEEGRRFWEGFDG